MTTEKSYTILEWFEMAKEQGAEWAESAIEQTDELDKNKVVRTLERALSDFEFWNKTKEGYEFWQDVYASDFVEQFKPSEKC